MKISVAFALMLSATAQASSPSEAARNYSTEQYAKVLLNSIVSKDARALIRVANNPKVFDAVAVAYLVGHSTDAFPEKPQLKPAADVLARGRILTKIVATESIDGSLRIDIVFLPTKTASSFDGLSRLIKSGKAVLFRDYIMCAAVRRGSQFSMPHACYAETDVIE